MSGSRRGPVGARAFVLVASGVTAVCGASILAAWLSGQPGLAMLGHEQAVADLGTALGLALGGVATIALSAGWRRVAGVPAVVVCVIGSIALSQYAFSDPFDGGWLSFLQYGALDSLVHTRMVPNCAVALVAAGVAVLAMPRYPFAAALLATLVLTMGAVALVGYATGAKHALAWGAAKPMALNTAVGLTALATALVVEAFRQRPSDEPSLRWMPYILGLTGALIGLLLWQALRAEDSAQFRRTVEATADGVRGQIVARVYDKIVALRHLAAHGTRLGWGSTQEWQADAQLSVGAFASFELVEWITPNYKTPVVAARDEPPRELAYAPETDALLHEGVEYARATGQPAAVGPFPFANGGHAYRVLVPLHAPDKPEAYLSGVFSAGITFANLSQTVAPGYYVEILCRDLAVYRRGDLPPSSARAWSQTETVSLPGGFDWEVVVIPQAHLLQAQRTALPEVVLAASLTIAVLLGLSAQFAEMALQRARRFQNAVAERTAELQRALEDLRAENAARRRGQNTLERTQAVTRLLSGELGMDTLAQAVVDAARELTGATGGVFFHGLGDHGSPQHALSQSAADDFAGLPQPQLGGERGLICLDDVTADPRYDAGARRETMTEVRSYLAVGVGSQTGELQGRLLLAHAEPAMFGERERQIATSLAAQATIALANARLYQAERRANAAKDQFMAMLGHELRNPLGAIDNALKALDLRGEDIESDSRMRGILQRQVGHLTDLVDDLLEVSRIERGQLRVDRQRMDLVPMVRERAELARSGIEAVGLKLGVELTPGPVWIDGDATRLGQILDNLLGNAVKFTPAGGDIRVGLSTDAERRQAVVSVVDTGAGLDEPELERLFKPFEKGDDFGGAMQGGLGLGLPLAKGLALAHDAQIDVHSEGRGRGAEFRLRLPLREAPAIKAATDRPASASAARRRILIIDDHRDSAQGLSELLDLQGHEVQVAYDGASGVRAARQMRPDVVLCDLGLPDMDGFQVAAALMADGQAARPRFYALTGYGDDETLRRVRAAGFAQRLLKPVEPSQLRELLSA